MDADKKKDKIYSCTNCGLMGHSYSKCNEPITSWGIILVKILSEHKSSHEDKGSDEKIDMKQFDDQDGIRVSSIGKLESICNHMDLIRFLLVRRKHSLGYIEFIRGRYEKDNISGIIYLFQQMTPSEIRKLELMSFPEIWEDFWGGDSKKVHLNKKEYNESREKFESLKNKVGVELPLEFYIKNVKPFYENPEWGFPKGRKMRGEQDCECAVREFCEETGYLETDIKIMTNIKPIIENMIGTNGVSYRHIYYVAEDMTNKNPNINDTIGNTEIGDIGFFSYEETNKMFREYHIEKKNITKNVFLYYLDLLTDDRQNETTKWKIDDDGI